MKLIDRRAFVGMMAAAGAVAGGALAAGCASAPQQAVLVTEDCDGDGVADSGRDGGDAALDALPAPHPDPQSAFGVDLDINMATIDAWLGRPVVAYRDCRMLFDPAHWEDLGGDAYATSCLPGFKLVPYPFLATLPELPVEGAYAGTALFELSWDDDGAIVRAEPLFAEAKTMLEELFPRDRALFLCCGGGGYAGFTRNLLLFLGWDASLVYNVGGMWDYEGERGIPLVEYGTNGDDDVLCTWRADYAIIDFTLLTPYVR